MIVKNTDVQDEQFVRDDHVGRNRHEREPAARLAQKFACADEIARNPRLLPSIAPIAENS
jgi:hypothetical protein